MAAHNVFPPGGMPDDRLPTCEGVSYEYGPLHVTILESDEPVEPDTLLYRWLLEDLSLSEKPWKILLMRQPIFLPAVNRKWIPLARLLESARVGLVIGTGRGYRRTIPIGPSAARGVRYVTLGTGEVAEQDRRSWLAHSAGGPHFCVAEASEDHLEWTVYDQYGRIADLVTFKKRGTIRRFISIGEILSEERKAERRKESGTVKEKIPSEGQD